MPTMPDDATGDAIRQWESEGSDLSRSMEIDFFVAVPTKAAGIDLSKRLGNTEFKLSVEQSKSTLAWTCYCTKEMIPDYSAIVEVEERLDRLGREVGGKADGFGSSGNAIAPGH